MSQLVRAHNEDDIGYVFDTYLNTWRHSNFAGTIRNNLFYDAQRQTLEDLIARGAKILVACDDRTPGVIQGWACYELKEELPILHYIYERPGYRTLNLLIDAIPGKKPGFTTHRQNLRELSAWKNVPEIARRKTL